MDDINLLSIGQVVSSKAGRDKGYVFVVIDILDDDHVLIADGDLRRIERPKKKKNKHLQKHNKVLEKVKEKLENKEKLVNIELQKELEKSGIIWLEL